MLNTSKREGDRWQDTEILVNVDHIVTLEPWSYRDGPRASFAPSNPIQWGTRLTLVDGRQFTMRRDQDEVGDVIYTMQLTE